MWLEKIQLQFSLVQFWPPANFKTVERLSERMTQLDTGYAIDDERDDALGQIHKSRAELKGRSEIALALPLYTREPVRASASLCLTRGGKLRRHHVTKWGWMGAARPALGPEIARLSLSVPVSHSGQTEGNVHVTEFTITKYTIECVVCM